MILMIITGASAFSQILAFSGATAAIVKLTVGLPLPPLLFVAASQAILLVLGMFIGPIAMLMITLPMFIPLVEALGFDLIWFGILLLLNIEMGSTSPPVGAILFVMKGVAPKEITMAGIYRSVIPFVALQGACLGVIMVFPQIALWLPNLVMGR